MCSSFLLSYGSIPLEKVDMRGLTSFLLILLCWSIWDQQKDGLNKFYAFKKTCRRGRKKYKEELKQWYKYKTSWYMLTKTMDLCMVQRKFTHRDGPGGDSHGGYLGALCSVLLRHTVATLWWTYSSKSIPRLADILAQGFKIMPWCCRPQC